MSVRTDVPANPMVPFTWLTFAAPAAAIFAGVCAQLFEDRQLLLIPMGLGVLGTSYALARNRAGLWAIVTPVAVGMLAWAGEQLVYSIVHVTSGEQFTAERFGPQWAQVVLLTLAHATFLGIPTGLIAALLLRLPPLRQPDLREHDAVR